ncbi:MAG: GTPase ObgE [Bdellovibrionales bacterium]|nr:GTPase ObgE [Bdellovibrionales bacterium]
MKFIDEVKITVASGKGGPGAVSFRREAKVPRGGPDGGDGGDGGSVLFEVDDRLNSLLNFQFTKRYFAENGKPGAGQHKQGKSGKDAVIKVPPGTLIKDDEENLIRDMGAEGEFLFLKGGKGGKGNTFYKSSVQQAPEKAQKGLPGEERELRLELKLMADIGLVGRPNAGKSTLISAVSASKPKIADYPFTTLTPNLGVVRHGDFDSFVLADIPGLIRGASEGVGLGIQFLKHIERTRAFVHLVDVSEFNELEPIEAYKEIRGELEKYASENQTSSEFEPLDKRPELVVLNKIDAVDEKRLDEVKMSFIKEDISFLLISAATRRGLGDLVNKMAEFALQNSTDSVEEETP